MKCHINVTVFRDNAIRTHTRIHIYYICTFSMTLSTSTRSLPYSVIYFVCIFSVPFMAFNDSKMSVKYPSIYGNPYLYVEQRELYFFLFNIKV